MTDRERPSLSLWRREVARGVAALLILASAVLPAGAELGQAWAVEWSPPSEDLRPEILGMGAGGGDHVMMVGSLVRRDGASVYLVLSFRETGELNWARTFPSEWSGTNTLRSYSYYGSGVLLTGTGGTYKVDKSGAVVWHAPYGGTDIAHSVGMDVVITGIHPTHVATIKLEPDGEPVWLRREETWPGDDGHNSLAQKVAVSLQNQVYVAGFERVTTGRFNDWKPCLFKYSPDGNREWKSEGAPLLLRPEQMQLLTVRDDGGATLGWDSRGESVTLQGYSGSGTLAFSTRLVSGRLLPYRGLEFLSAGGQVRCGWFDGHCTGVWRMESVLTANDQVTPMWKEEVASAPMDSALGAIQEVIGAAWTGDAIEVVGTSSFPDGRSRVVAHVRPEKSYVRGGMFEYEDPLGRDLRAKAIARAAGMFVGCERPRLGGSADVVLVRFVGHSRMEFTGETMDALFERRPFQTVTIQASEDLKVWRNVATNTADAWGRISYRERYWAPGGVPRRFYRVKE